MIELKNIHVTFGAQTPWEKKALQGINLTINQGEFITVIGSNGAGKSTLLNTIAGEIFPTEGIIKINNIDVTNDSTHKRAGAVARVFQDPLVGTCSDFTIAENFALAHNRGHNLSLKSALNKSQKIYYEHLLSRLDLKINNALDLPIGSLSGGQRQALSLLMTTMSPLQVLLLDEHTSALDPKNAQFVMQLTQEIVEEKKLSALMVTHSMQQALSTGTRTIMLHEGKIIYDVAGPQRSSLTIADLMEKFAQNIDDDRLLLGL